MSADRMNPGAESRELKERWQRSSVGVPPAPGLRPPDFVLWQLIDSAFPTGGFAHSGGLEAAWQHGEVGTRVELSSFLEASLHQAGRSALPLVLAAHAEPERLTEFDRLCDAFMNNHVANRASRLQGRAFLLAVEGVFPALISHARSTSVQPPFSHLAPVFGAVARWFHINELTTTRLFLFSHLRSLLAAAVRLNIVGPMAAQRMQFHLSGRVEAMGEQSAGLTLADLAQTAPLLDLWQGAQDRLYSRLFQS